MKIIKRNFLKEIFIKNYVVLNKLISKFKKKQNICFLIGVFLLAAAPALASIFFIMALIPCCLKNKSSFFKDSFNYPFLVVGIYLIISSIIHFFDPYLRTLEINHLSLIGVLNWLPFFWFYSEFEIFLSSFKKRVEVINVFLIGSIPVLLSGLGQYFLNWHGPFNFFNGLVIWFQRPLAPDEGITGLFNNPNYMGCWITMIFPFSIFLLKTLKKRYQKILIFFLICILLLIALLTYSRSCWATIIISIPMLFGKRILIWFVPFISILLTSIFLASYDAIPENVKMNFRDILPDNIWLQFSDIGFKNIDSSRIEIFQNAISLIKENLLFGWGGGTFPNIIFNKTGTWLGHTHNLFIELAFNYGIIPALIVLFTFSFLFVKSFSRKNFFHNIRLTTDLNFRYFTNKVWWISTILLLSTQMVDVQYYDIRISLSLWILITGLKCMIKENILLLNEKNSFSFK